MVMRINLEFEREFYNKIVTSYFDTLSKIADYFSGMYTNPKYVLIRQFFAGPWFPDENIIAFLFLTKIGILK